MQKIFIPILLLLALLLPLSAQAGDGIPTSIQDILTPYIDQGYMLAAVDARLNAGIPGPVAAAIVSRDGENILLLLQQTRHDLASGGYATGLTSALAIPQGEGIVFDLLLDPYDDNSSDGPLYENLVVTALDKDAQGLQRRRLYMFTHHRGTPTLSYTYSQAIQWRERPDGLFDYRRFLNTPQDGDPIDLQTGITRTFLDESGMLGIESRWHTGIPQPGIVETFYWESLPFDLDTAGLTLVNHALTTHGDWPSDIQRGQMLPVYAGPGAQYYRASEGKAAVSTNESFSVLGSDGDWAMISYDVGDRYRYGYIEKAALPADFTVIPLHFGTRQATLSRDCQLIDGPMSSNRRLVHLQVKDDWQITVLCETSSTGTLYIEATNASRAPVRGFLDERYITYKQ